MCSDLFIAKTKCTFEVGSKDSCETFYENCRKISIIMEFTVIEKLQYLEFAKYIFLEMFELFNIITVQILTTRCDFNKDYCNKFDDSNFDIHNYCFLLHEKLL